MSNHRSEKLFGIPIITDPNVPQNAGPITFSMLKKAYMKARQRKRESDYYIVHPKFLSFLQSVYGIKLYPAQTAFVQSMDNILKEADIEIDEKLMKEYEAYLASEENP